jgi:hypothetical protein
VAPSGNQTATEKTNTNLKRSDKPAYSPKAGCKRQRLSCEINFFISFCFNTPLSDPAFSAERMAHKSSDYFLSAGKGTH